MRKLLVSLVVSGLLLAAVVLPGCSGEDTIKIGTLLPLTGSLADYGPAMQQGVELAVKQINAAGGVLGKEIELINEDSETTAAAASDAMNKFVEIDEIVGFVGAAGSTVSLAVIDTAKDYKVVQISPSNTGTLFTEYDDDDFYYRTCPSDALQGEAMAILAQDEGYATAVTLAVNNDYGVGFEADFQSSFEELGGTVTKNVHFEEGATSFDSEVAEAVGANADVIVLVAYPTEGAEILKKAYETGGLDSCNWLLSEGLRSEDLAEAVGTDTEGNYIITGLKGTTPDDRVAGNGYVDFVAAFNAEYGEDPGIFVSNSYDAVVLMALAMEHSGNASGEGIKEGIRAVANAPGQKVSDITTALELLRAGEEIDYEGASGELTMDSNGDVSGSYCQWSITAEGAIKLGDPIDLS